MAAAAVTAAAIGTAPIEAAAAVARGCVMAAAIGEEAYVAAGVGHEVGAAPATRRTGYKKSGKNESERDGNANRKTEIGHRSSPSQYLTTPPFRLLPPVTG